MSIRYDSATLGKAEITPQGGLKIPATLTRVGVFSYLQPDGTVRREYRSPAEVFAPEALASLAGAPLTVNHPREMVSTRNWRTLAVGHVGNSPHPAEDQIHVQDFVYVQDASTIEGIEQYSEISLGYEQKYIAQPGITPQGEDYDGLQTMLRYNHAALVPRGRAGRSVGLRLDAEDNQLQDQGQEKIMEITIAGKVYKAGSPEAVAALAALEQRSARADQQDAELARLLGERKSRMRKACLDAGVSIRQDADESSMAAAFLAKLVPGLSVEGQSPEFIMGAFAAALEMALAEKGKPAEKPATPPAPAPAQGAEGARQDTAETPKVPELPKSKAQEAHQKMVSRLAGR